MDLDAALTVFGLTREATPVDVGETYRKIRKPLLKELNKYDDADQPAELVDKLDEVDTAYKILQQEIKPPPREATQRTTGSTTKRTTGRVSFARGDVLAGRYEIEALIAHRPEGDTYRVRDQIRGVRIGMKVIAPQLLAEPRARGRLLRGLLAATRVSHPHLARVLDIHPLQSTYAVTLQIPEGAENLWDLMYGAEGDRDRLTTRAVMDMTRQATHALAELHRTTQHAALRPESIWLARDGTVKVADYGFAEVRGRLRERRLSRTKLGTAYWAPEQYGDTAAIDGRCDQYSLALILYEILSGKPLVGRTQKIRSFRKDYPQRFTDAIERALASKPDRRFDDMNAFGNAAFSGYRAEGAPPAASRESMLVPVLLLFALFVGAAISPIGRSLADKLGAAVGSWQRAESEVADADRDMRRLIAMSGRLEERGEALDETSRKELAKAREALDEGLLDPEKRSAINDDLAEIVRKLVADSSRRAEVAMATQRESTDALERLGLDARAMTSAAIESMRREYDPSAPLSEREKAMVALLRALAARDKADAAWRAERARVRGLPERATALRSLLEAEAALAIGDEAATGKAYDVAASALSAIDERAKSAVAAVPSFEPDATTGRANDAEGEDREKLLDALIDLPSDVTDDPELARVLAGLRKEAIDAADVRWLVHDEGYWTFAATVSACTFLAGGTWTGDATTARMRTIVFGGRLLDAPFELEATRGGDRPGLGDVREALVRGPRDARAWWSTGGGAALPAARFEPAQRTVEAGELRPKGRLDGAGACVVCEARRFEVAEDGSFEARVKIPGDALGLWVRAHGAHGLRSGAAGWLRLKTDVLKPQVKILKPVEGAALDGDKDIEIRVLVYDSNLATIEVGGEAQSFRPDAIYTVIEFTRHTPAVGRLEETLRAVDAADNEITVQLDWPIR